MVWRSELKVIDLPPGLATDPFVGDRKSWQWHQRPT
jgi:hypothetical protein